MKHIPRVWLVTSNHEWTNHQNRLVREAEPLKWTFNRFGFPAVLFWVYTLERWASFTGVHETMKRPQRKKGSNELGIFHAPLQQVLSRSSLTPYIARFLWYFLVFKTMEWKEILRGVYPTEYQNSMNLLQLPTDPLWGPHWSNKRTFSLCGL